MAKPATSAAMATASVGGGATRARTAAAARTTNMVATQAGPARPVAAGATAIQVQSRITLLMQIAIAGSAACALLQVSRPSRASASGRRNEMETPPSAAKLASASARRTSSMAIAAANQK